MWPCMDSLRGDQLALRVTEYTVYDAIMMSGLCYNACSLHFSYLIDFIFLILLIKDIIL